MLFRVVLAVAVLAIFVYGLVDVIRTDGRLTRGISKPAWIIVMVVLPVLGAILWLLIGRPRGSGPVRQASGHPIAPDDDPDFLRNLELRRRKQAEAARLKKLKDELAAKEKSDGGTGGSGPAPGTRGGKATGDGGAGGTSSPDADTRDTGDVK
ncbi:PLD nuclease N-terminal domain-containing protein [Pseudarthrobacter sp. YS3]|uniref:PLD nuclease N-terminal domain-containing protein n=1 Tax=Pseudarthrobacter sp. YS3 TaxID=3453718 RepID=UPI003EEA8548